MYRVFPGGKERPGRHADPSPLLVPWSRKSTATPLLPLWAVRPVQSLTACTRVHFTLLIYNCLWDGYQTPSRKPCRISLIKALWNPLHQLLNCLLSCYSVIKSNSTELRPSPINDYRSRFTLPSSASVPTNPFCFPSYVADHHIAYATLLYVCIKAEFSYMCLMLRLAGLYWQPPGSVD